MTTSPAALAASIILLFPMGYFFLAAPLVFVALPVAFVKEWRERRDCFAQLFSRNCRGVTPVTRRKAKEKWL